MEAKLEDLRDQRRVFDKKVIELRVHHRDEQADVDKLEGKSLANYFFQIVGKLRRFKTELADINISADMQVNINGFLRFADYFFDGLFADWAVRDRISESQTAVYRVRSQISTALNKLSGMDAAVDREIDMLKARVEELLMKVL